MLTLLFSDLRWPFFYYWFFVLDFRCYRFWDISTMTKTNDSKWFNHLLTGFVFCFCLPGDWPYLYHVLRKTSIWHDEAANTTQLSAILHNTSRMRCPRWYLPHVPELKFHTSLPDLWSPWPHPPNSASCTGKQHWLVALHNWWHNLRLIIYQKCCFVRRSKVSWTSQLSASEDITLT